MAAPPALWRIKKAIFEFKRRLLKAQGDNVLQIIVFGSVARNEQREGSDIDIFVLLKENERTLEDSRQVAYVSTTLNIEKCRHGIYISPLVCEKDWYDQNRKKSLVFYDIDSEGALVYDSEN